MNNKYTIAYIGAVIAIPVALLFIVPAVATTNAFEWGATGDEYSSFEKANTQGEGSVRAWGGNRHSDEDADADTSTHTWSWGENDSHEGDENSNEDYGGEENSDEYHGDDEDSGEGGVFEFTWGHGWSHEDSEGDSCEYEDEDENDHEDECDSDCGDDDHDWCEDHDCCTDCVTVDAPTCTLTAEPQTTWWSGEEVVLTWTTENADSVQISGIGYASLDGSEAVYPTQNTTYTLTAEGEGGTVQCTDTVAVKHEEDTDEVSCDAFTANDYDINEGESTVLNWSTTDAETVTIDQGVGTVSEDGTISVSPNKDTKYTLTARNGDAVDTCDLTIAVDEDDDDDTNPRCDAFTVSDGSVRRGSTVTLNWNTSYADDVSIDQGVGTVPVDGSREVTVNSDTVYTLTARDGSKSNTCEVRVDVQSSGGGGGGSSKKTPRCVFSITDNQLYKGQSAVLSWDNEYTDRLVLKEGNKTLADTKKDKDVDEDKDKMTVSPDKTTTYTLDVYNGSKHETCELDVKVGGGMVSGISLSQVPYTGFDAGPMLTAIFYGAIVLWGLVLAYALVLKKKNYRKLSN